MDKKQKIINGVKVTYVNTDKFKSICGILCFKTKVTEEKMTTRSLFRDIMMHSCKKFPTNEKLNINCIENYDAYYSAFTRRDGNYFTNIFLFRTLDNRFTSDNNLENVLDTFYEIIFNPNVKDGKFNDEEYNLAYNELEAHLQTELERAKQYAMKKIDKQMGQNTVIGYSQSLDILHNITNESLYNDYLDMINNSEVSMYIAGHEALKIDVSKYLSNIKTKTVKEEISIKSNINKKINSVIEEYDGMQSILTVGLKLDNLTKYEKSLVLPVFNNILGGGTSSRLFSTVREENSLCYFCYSKYEKDDNIIQIVSGIEYQNYDKALKIIIDVINSMKNIKKEEVATSLNDIISYLIESEDNLNNYVIPTYLQEIYDEVSVEEKIELIKKVTKEDVEKLFDKIFITDSFFLKGGASNE